MIVRAFARAGRVANALVFLLTDEKALSGGGWVGCFSSFVVQFGVLLGSHRAAHQRAELLLRPAGLV